MRLLALLTNLVIFVFTAQAAVIPATRNLIGGAFLGEPRPQSLHAEGGFRDWWFTISTSAQVRVTASGTSEDITVLDANITRQTGVSTVDDMLVIVTESPWIKRRESLTITSLNLGILTNPTDLLCTHVAPGTVTIQAASATLTKTTSATTTSLPGQTVDTVNSYVFGSLAKHLRDEVDERLSGKNVGTYGPIYSTNDQDAPLYVRNSNLWAVGIDLTGIGVWYSAGATVARGTLISPRHVICAAHFANSIGGSYRFVKEDGAIVTRTVIGAQRHTLYTPYVYDIQIALLDSDVPAGINLVKVLPDNWQTKVPSFDGVPAFGPRQTDVLNVRDTVAVNSSSQTSFRAPTDEKRLSFYASLVGGDSSNPVFWTINSTPILLGVWTFGGAGMGWSVTASKSAINSLMTSLDAAASPPVTSAYQLSEINLSGFPSFP